MRLRHPVVVLGLVLSWAAYAQTALADSDHGFVPQEGSPRTTFLLRYDSAGVDVGPDPGGDVLQIRGPRDSRCRGIQPVNVGPVDGGPRRLYLGPAAKVPRGKRRSGEAVRPKDRNGDPLERWCPGPYVANIDNDASTGSTSDRFTFLVA